MGERPKISVVIPTYNRSHVLPRAVASVVAQDEPDWELIVVDDASTDDTKRYLAELTDPRVRVVVLPRNAGVSCARNRGIEEARAEIVAFLDSDDVYLPRQLSARLAAFAGDPDIVCTLSSGLVRYNRKPDQVVNFPDVTLSSSAFRWGVICRLFSAGGTNITVRREAALAVGGFQLGLKQGEDQEFLVRLARQGRGRLLSEVLWVKHLSTDALSLQWRQAGPELIVQVQSNPEYIGKYRKVMSYFASKILVYDLRRGSVVTFLRDLRDFRRAGLIDGNLPRMWRDHRDLRRYRRAASGCEALARLNGPPTSW